MALTAASTQHRHSVTWPVFLSKKRGSLQIPLVAVEKLWGELDALSGRHAQQLPCSLADRALM